MQMLLEKGDVESTGQTEMKRKTPIHLTYEAKNTVIVKILINGQWPVHLLAKDKRVRFVVRRCHPRAYSRGNGTASAVFDSLVVKAPPSVPSH